MKRVFAALSLIIMLSFLVSCSGYKTEMQPEETNNSLNKIGHDVEFGNLYALFNDNPIDKTFAMAANERDELKENIIFAYLHALEWRNAYNDIKTEYNGKSIFCISNDADMLYAAYEYGKNKAVSSDIKQHFEGIARFYKTLTVDCLEQLAAQGINAGINSNEDDIYRYLNSINYDGHFDYNGFEIVPWLESENNPNPMPAIAGVEGEDIFFNYCELGAVLSVRGEQRLFMWDYMTPRLIMPQLELSDFNGDGEDELAVILYSGSGTGISIEELHIIDLTYYSDTLVTSHNIEEKLRNRFFVQYEPNLNRVAAKLDDQSISVDVSRIEKETHPYFEGAAFNSIIDFEANDGMLSVHIAVGLYGFNMATPFDYVDFYADLRFDESYNLLLSNRRIEYTPQP